MKSTPPADLETNRSVSFAFGADGICNLLVIATTSAALTENWRFYCKYKILPLLLHLQKTAASTASTGNCHFECVYSGNWRFYYEYRKLLLLMHVFRIFLLLMRINKILPLLLHILKDTARNGQSNCILQRMVRVTAYCKERTELPHTAKNGQTHRILQKMVRTTAYRKEWSDLLHTAQNGPIYCIPQRMVRFTAKSDAAFTIICGVGQTSFRVLSKGIRPRRAARRKACTRLVTWSFS
jgi:hypothetical protein